MVEGGRERENGRESLGLSHAILFIICTDSSAQCSIVSDANSFVSFKFDSPFAFIGLTTFGADVKGQSRVPPGWCTVRIPYQSINYIGSVLPTLCMQDIYQDGLIRQEEICISVDLYF